MPDEFNLPSEFDKLNNSEKQILIDWCSRLSKIKSINLKHSSYGLKHIFEQSKNGFYITNGMFKGAMLECSFDYKLVDSSSVNWLFNISEKSIQELQKLNAD